MAKRGRPRKVEATYTHEMQYDVLAHKDAFLSKYSDLQKVEGWKNYDGSGFEGIGPIDEPWKVLAYFVILGSPDSPIHRLSNKNITLQDRKIIALQELGFEHAQDDVFTGENPRHARQLLNLDRDGLLKLFIAYLKYQSNSLFNTWYIKYKLYWENFDRLMSPILDEKDKDSIMSSQKKMQLMSENDALSKEIERLEQKIFFGELSESLSVKNRQYVMNLFEAKR